MLTEDGEAIGGERAEAPLTVWGILWIDIGTTRPNNLLDADTRLVAVRKDLANSVDRPLSQSAERAAP